MGQSYRYRRRVEFRDTDAAGIVHFSVFFAYMEQAEHDFWRSLGTSVYHRTGDGKVSWPRVSAKCDYLVAIKFEENIDIDLCVIKIGSKSLNFGFAFRRGEDVVAQGEVTTVCCSIGEDRSMKSIAIPDDIRKMLEPFLIG